MRKLMRKIGVGLQKLLLLGVCLLAMGAAAQLALQFEVVKQWRDRTFFTPHKMAVELLENQQIAELATRKMKWKILTVKESVHESLVIETIYTLKFGFDLSEINANAVRIDPEAQTVTICLPPVRLLSVDTFGDSKQLVAKKTFLARVIKPSHEGALDDAAAKQQLIQELREQHLIDSTELAADFQKALAPLWDSRSTFALKVEPFAEEVDVEALFDDYQRRK